MSVLYSLPLFPTVASSTFRDPNAAARCSSRALVAFAANRGNSGPPKQSGTGGPTLFPGWLVESSFSSGLNSVSLCHLYTTHQQRLAVFLKDILAFIILASL